MEYYLSGYRALILVVPEGDVSAPGMKAGGGAHRLEFNEGKQKLTSKDALFCHPAAGHAESSRVLCKPHELKANKNTVASIPGPICNKMATPTSSRIHSDNQFWSREEGRQPRATSPTPKTPASPISPTSPTSPTTLRNRNRDQRRRKSISNQTSHKPKSKNIASMRSARRRSSSRLSVTNALSTGFGKLILAAADQDRRHSLPLSLNTSGKLEEKTVTALTTFDPEYQMIYRNADVNEKADSIDKAICASWDTLKLYQCPLSSPELHELQRVYDQDICSFLNDLSTFPTL